jgi:hypothetical protein
MSHFSSHDTAMNAVVTRSKYFLVSFPLVCTYFLLDLFREIFAQESSTVSIEIFYTRQQNSVCSAEGATPFAFPRHLYEASATEHVLAMQSDGPISNGETDGTEIVIQLWNDRNKFGRHFNIMG